MGAGPWTLYMPARGHLADGAFDLDNDAFKMSLYQATSNAGDMTRTAIEELSHEVPNGNGYVTGGQSLSGVVWALGPDPRKVRFNANASVWTATGGDIVGIRYATIWRPKPGANLLLLVAALDENADINVPDGNGLTVAPNPQGMIFELSSVQRDPLIAAPVIIRPAGSIRLTGYSPIKT